MVDKTDTIILKVPFITFSNDIGDIVQGDQLKLSTPVFRIFPFC